MQSVTGGILVWRRETVACEAEVVPQETRLNFTNPGGKGGEGSQRVPGGLGKQALHLPRGVGLPGCGPKSAQKKWDLSGIPAPKAQKPLGTFGHVPRRGGGELECMPRQVPQSGVSHRSKFSLQVISEPAGDIGGE